MDIDTIPPGVDFNDYVRRAVGSCDVLLAFIGERWIDLTDDSGRRRIDDPQDWVVEEISVALRRGVRVIPVLVDGAVMPRLDQLPDSLAPLVSRQALPLRHSSFAADLSRLIAGIGHAGAERSQAEALAAEHFDRWESSGVPEKPRPSLPQRIPVRRSRPNRLLVGMALVVVAALVGAGFAIFHPFQRAAPPPGSASSSVQVSTRPVVTPSARASARPRPTVTPARTVEQLRNHVPAAFRRTCRRLETDSGVLRSGLVVAVQCVPSQGSQPGRQPSYVFYLQYANPSAALAAFRGYYALGEVPVGDCTDAPGEQAYRRRDGAGTLRCYQDAEAFRVFAWTNDDLAMLASAADQTMTYGELAAWWRNAGPLR